MRRIVTPLACLIVLVLLAAPLAEAGPSVKQRTANLVAALKKQTLSKVEFKDAELKDVVRTRMFVTDISQWPAIARAHSEAFGEAPPATSMVEVSQLIDPAMIVEIEADAIVEES